MSSKGLAVAALLAAQLGCIGGESEESGDSGGTGTSSSSCSALTGTPWVPSVSGTGGANHDDASLTTVRTVKKGSTLVTGWAQPVTPITHQTTLTFTVGAVGAHGSITLVAETQSYPSALSALSVGTPYLISLTDSLGQEWVQLPAACTTLSVSPYGLFAAACLPAAASAFPGATAQARWDQYEQSQSPGAPVSVNRFPTCNWAAGSPTCNFAAGATYFSGGTLPAGTYTAKYGIIAIPLDDYYDYEDETVDNVGDFYTAGVKLTVIEKRDADASGTAKGTVDLNLVLVGNQNINDSRTAKGKANLNALLTHVQGHYFTENAGRTDVNLGRINVYEWDCENGGDAYATVSDTEALFKAGSALLPLATEGKALNIFLVSQIEDEDDTYTILGLAGAIGGPPINGTIASGLAFSTFDRLATFNPVCPIDGSECLLSKQEFDFIDMGSTVSHEMGHFLGLNHPSEAEGTYHDAVPDTPECTTTESTSIGDILTIDSCYADANLLSGVACATACPGYDGVTTFCPTVMECQFNHTMWWTSKSYVYGAAGDGNLFSTNSAQIVNYSPYVQ